MARVLPRVVVLMNASLNMMMMTTRKTSLANRLLEAQTSQVPDVEDQAKDDGEYEGPTYEWILEDVCRLRSIYHPESDVSFFLYRIDGPGQERALEGVLWDDAVCHSPSVGHKFFVYSIMVNELRIRTPFTDFKQIILRTLKVAPLKCIPTAGPS